MKLSMSELRETIADIVREEAASLIDEAVQKRMRSLAVSLIAEARLSAEDKLRESANQIKSVKPARVVQAAGKSVMDEVLRDTAERTLPKITEADRRSAAQDEAATAASDKLARLAFTTPMPTRTSTVPAADSRAS